jgi:hypothetical protein
LKPAAYSESLKYDPRALIRGNADSKWNAAVRQGGMPENHLAVALRSDGILIKSRCFNPLHRYNGFGRVGLLTERGHAR